MKTIRLSALLMGLSFFGCEVAKQTFDAPSSVPPATTIIPADPYMSKNVIDQTQLGSSNVHHDQIAQVSLMPKPPTEEAPFRSRRRMDLDQLNAAIKTVTGGLEWEINGQNQFVALASTLGKPEFATITQEDLDPTAMFLKFLNDASRDVCFRLAEADAQRAPANRILFHHASPEATLSAEPNAIELNLVYLLKRFHGMSSIASCEDCDEGDPNALGNELQQWVWLYQAAEHVSSSPSIAWRTVCVALINHPDFYMY
jgi:hypothetical protein